MTPRVIPLVLFSGLFVLTATRAGAAAIEKAGSPDLAKFIGRAATVSLKKVPATPDLGTTVLVTVSIGHDNIISATVLPPALAPVDPAFVKAIDLNPGLGIDVGRTDSTAGPFLHLTGPAAGKDTPRPHLQIAGLVPGGTVEIRLSEFERHTLIVQLKDIFGKGYPDAFTP